MRWCCDSPREPITSFDSDSPHPPRPPPTIWDTQQTGLTRSDVYSHLHGHVHKDALWYSSKNWDYWTGSNVHILQKHKNLQKSRQDTWAVQHKYLFSNLSLGCRALLQMSPSANRLCMCGLPFQHLLFLLKKRNLFGCCLVCILPLSPLFSSLPCGSGSLTEKVDWINGWKPVELFTCQMFVCFKRNPSETFPAKFTSPTWPHLRPMNANKMNGASKSVQVAGLWDESFIFMFFNTSVSCDGVPQKRYEQLIFYLL